MADTLVGSNHTSFDHMSTRRYSCSTAPGVVYCAFVDAAADLRYRKFSSGTWSSATLILAATVTGLDVYYDKWTKNVTTTKLLMAYNDLDSDDGLFNALDVSDDTLDGETIPLAGTTATSEFSLDVHHASIVRAEGGNIYVFNTIDAGTELGFARSVDDGVNWAARSTTTLWEVAGDRLMLLPGNEAGINDIYALFYDESAGELTLKTYDNSGDSWSESSAILSGLATALGIDDMPMAAAQRHSDGHIIAVVATDKDDAGADLKVVDITNGTTFSTLTDVITNVDDWYYPSIFIDQQTGDIYVTYLGKDDGTEALLSAVKCYYQKSTNGGSTWGGELAMGVDTADDHRGVSTGVSVGDDGGNFMPIWFNDDLNRLLCNLDNDIEIAAATGITAALTGTALPSATEAEIAAGGETVIITLTDDTWVTVGGTFDAQRQAIIDGFDAATSPALGWNDEVRDKAPTSVAVRTDDTTVTMTWTTAASAYDISGAETITVTIPASALTTSGDPVIADETFEITVVVTGRVMSSLAGAGGLAGMGGIAGKGGGLAA